MINDPHNSQNIFDALDVAISVVENDNSISYFNQAFEELNRLSGEPDQKIKIEDIYPKETAKRVSDLLEKLRSEEKKEKTSILYTSKQRTERHDVFTAISDAQGKTIQVLIKSQELNAILEDDLSDLTIDDEEAEISDASSQSSGEEKSEGFVDKEQHFLAKLNDITSGSYSSQILMERILNLLLEFLNIESGMIKALDETEKNILSPITFHGVSDGFVKKSSNMQLGECICAKAVKELTPVYTKNAAKDREFKCSICKEEGFKFILAIPIIAQESVKAIIQLCSHKVKTLEDYELILMETAAKIIGDSFEKADINEKNALTQRFLKNMLNRTEENVIIVTKNGKIDKISSPLAELTGIAPEPINTIDTTELFGSNFTDELKNLFNTDNYYPKPENITHKSFASLNSPEGEIKTEINVYPIEDDGGSYAGSLLKLENLTQKEKFEKEKKERAQELTFLVSLLDVMKNSQDLVEATEKAVNETARYIPINEEQFIVYSLDENKKELTIKTFKGMSPEFINENSVIKTENSDYANVIATAEPESISIPSTSIWKTAIPILRKNNIEGVLVLFGQTKLSDSPKNLALLFRTAAVVGIFSHCGESEKSSKEENSICTDIIESLADVLRHSDADEKGDNTLESFLMTLLAISNYDKIIVKTMSGPSSMDKIAIARTEPLTQETVPAVIPGSREEWVFQNHASLYEKNISESSKQYNGDEDSSPQGSVYVIPIFKNGSIRGTLRLESELPNDREPFIDMILSLSSSILLMKITVDQEIEARETASNYYLEKLEQMTAENKAAKEELLHQNRSNKSLSESSLALQEEHDRLQSAITLYQDEIQLYTSKLKAAEEDSSNYKLDLAQINTEKNEILLTLDNSRKELEKTSKELEKTSEELEKTSEELEKTSEELGKTSEELEKTSEKLEKTSEELEKTSEELEKIKSQTGSSENQISEIQKELDGIMAVNRDMSEKIVAQEEKIKKSNQKEKELNDQIAYLELTAGSEHIKQNSAMVSDIFNKLQKSINFVISSEQLSETYETIYAFASDWFSVPPAVKIESGNLALFEKSLDELESLADYEQKKHESQALHLLTMIARVRGKELTMLKDLFRRLKLQS